jgi:hypothetical protein
MKKQRFSSLLGWLLAFAVVISFFLPWARVSADLDSAIEIARRLVGDQDDVVSSWLWMRTKEFHDLQKMPGEGYSGYQLILLSEEETISAALAKSFFQMLWGDVRPGFQMKTLALAPILAFLAGLFLALPKLRPSWLSAMAGAVLLFYLWMRFKLNESYTDRLLLHVELSYGLWITLFGLFLLGLLLLLRALTSPKWMW